MCQYEPLYISDVKLAANPKDCLPRIDPTANAQIRTRGENIR